MKPTILSAFFIMAVLLLCPALPAAARTTSSSQADSHTRFIGDDDDDNPPFKPTNGISGIISISNDGFGVSASYLKQFSPDLTGYASLSYTAGKGDNEVTSYDLYGNPSTLNQVNNFMIFPLSFGLQYRLFRKDITNSFRPYIELGGGPSLGYVLPIDQPFFKSFGAGYSMLGANVIVGFGANFGHDLKAIQGVSIRYEANVFAKGVQIIQGQSKSFFGGPVITLSFGRFF
jgi:hypothetical protein